MPLVDCSECNKKVSTEAINCPHCGVVVDLEKIKKKQKEGAKGCFIFFISILFIVILYNVFSSSEPDSSSKSLEAYVYSQQMVETQLKTPGIAEFPTFEDSFVNQSGNIYTIRSYVDSQNSFGANIRSTYTCILKYENDLFYLQSVNIN